MCVRSVLQTPPGLAKLRDRYPHCCGARYIAEQKDFHLRLLSRDIAQAPPAARRTCKGARFHQRMEQEVGPRFGLTMVNDQYHAIHRDSMAFTSWACKSARTCVSGITRAHSVLAR